VEGHVAVVGAGVIGSAWAARFALHGIDVKVSDPDPDVQRIIGEVLDNARAAWGELGLAVTNEGTISIAGSIEEAVAGAGHVQESAPENPTVKIPVLEAIAAACPADTVIASSTSGIKPSDLQPSIDNPGRFVVGHLAADDLDQGQQIDRVVRMTDHKTSGIVDRRLQVRRFDP